MKDVRVDKLVKRFGGVVAVDGVSFEVPKGKLLTLLGPSGCGKTTTLNIIAGFEHPDGGDVYVGDRLISARPRVCCCRRTNAISVWCFSPTACGRT